MEMRDVNKRMDELERQWFDADRLARSALAEIKSFTAEASAETMMAARDRLEDAERRQQAIMRQIEALEDSLLS